MSVTGCTPQLIRNQRIPPRQAVSDQAQLILLFLRELPDKQQVEQATFLVDGRPKPHFRDLGSDCR